MAHYEQFILTTLTELWRDLGKGLTVFDRFEQPRFDRRIHNLHCTIGDSQLRLRQWNTILAQELDIARAVDIFNSESEKAIENTIRLDRDIAQASQELQDALADEKAALKRASQEIASRIYTVRQRVDPNQMLRDKRYEEERAEKKLIECRGKLTDDLVNVTDQEVAALCELNQPEQVWGDWDVYNNPPEGESLPARASLGSAETAAVMRRDMNMPALRNGDDSSWFSNEGVLHQNLAHKSAPFWFTLKYAYVHPAVKAQNRIYGEAIRRVIPPSHTHLRLYNLKPWGQSSTPEPEQRAQIEAAKALPNELRGWVLLGPPGTSKTSLVSAYIIDRITMRVASDQWYRTPDRIGVWRIKASRWLDENVAWKTRDFKDRSIRPPELTIAAIQDVCDEIGFTPIVWIEELDKITVRKANTDLFDALVDAVYELNGLVIVTCNYTEKEFETEVSAATRRRLCGTNDEPDLFQFWNFHSAKKGRSR